MDDSERIQRIKDEIKVEWEPYADISDDDERFSRRISALLNHPKINQNCMVDAYYYDNSVIPEKMRSFLSNFNDVYLIFGITTEGEIISKWVGRWDLDSDDPIVNGKVIRPEKEYSNGSITVLPPEAIKALNSHLLSHPVPNINMFMRKDDPST